MFIITRVIKIIHRIVKAVNDLFDTKDYKTDKEEIKLRHSLKDSRSMV